MVRILQILMVCFWTTLMHSQVIVNPFEIKSRMDSVYQKQENSQRKNVFEARETASNITFSASNDSTEIEESTIVPPIVDPTENTESAENENPFEVSHVPIRKSKLQYDTEKNQTQPNSKKDKPTSSNAFIFWFILLGTLLLAIVINTQRGTLTRVFKSLTNENVLKLNHREDSIGLRSKYFLLYLCFFIQVSIFIYLLASKYYLLQGISLFLKILLGVLFVYISKHSFLKIIGYIFPIERDASLYSFSIKSFNVFIGLILIPINLMIAFGPIDLTSVVIYGAVLIISVVLLLQIVRGLLIGSKFITMNLFHFLLYLCAFEILPVLLLIKVIGDFGNA